MKSHGPFFGWMEMLPSICQHNLEQECFIAYNRTLGTLIHTHIYLLLPAHMKFHREENPHSPSHWAFHKPRLPQIKAAWPPLRHSSPTLAHSVLLVPQTLGLCAFLFSPFSEHRTPKPPSLHLLVFNLSVTLNNNPITSLNSIQDFISSTFLMALLMI